MKTPFESWLFRPAPRPEAVIRLFCFPYAGGGAAAYRAWPSYFPECIEVCGVQPPGREGRLREPPFARFSELVDAAVSGLVPHLDRSFALFGHSLGGVLAFEAARAFAVLGLPAPIHLFVSGRRAPHLSPRHSLIAHLGHDAFVSEVRRRYEGIPDEVFQNNDLMALLVPTLRADMAALEGYSYSAGPPLACPITAYGGEADPEATEPEIVAWAPYGSSTFRVRVFPGNHFFIQGSRAELASDVAQTLIALLAATTCDRVQDAGGGGRSARR